MATALPSLAIAEASMDLRFVTERHSNEYGKSKSYRDGINNAYQTWMLGYNDITTAQAETLRAFCVSVGKTGSISWTPIGQAIPLLFRIVDDPQFSYQGYEQWNVSITIEQIFDFE
jgi:phage-related protein